MPFIIFLWFVIFALLVVITALWCANIDLRDDRDFCRARWDRASTERDFLSAEVETQKQNAENAWSLNRDLKARNLELEMQRKGWQRLFLKCLREATRLSNENQQLTRKRDKHGRYIKQS